MRDISLPRLSQSKMIFPFTKSKAQFTDDNHPYRIPDAFSPPIYLCR